MNRLLTTLLVWLLMTMLPLHAVAASANMSCTPLPPPASPAQAMDHASHAASADAHAHHGMHAMDAGEPTADVDEAGKLSHKSCSACSAFCIGAVAPPSSLLALPSFDGSEAVLAAPADLVAGFIPDGPQRPPRR